MDKLKEENRHKPFLYKAEASKTAVLIVHGILGSPAQFEAATKMLHERGVTVMGVLLPGHGGSAKDFAAAKAADWRQEVRRAILLLKKNYERIFIVGHSLGGLLAINEAVENGVDGLILIATPMRIKFSLRALLMSIKVLLGNPNQDDDVMKSYRGANSVQAGPFWTYCRWIPRFWDLFLLMHKSRRLLNRVHCPVLTVQSRKDETVSWKSQQVLTAGLVSAPVELLLLEKSRHSHFHSDEVESMYERICRFVTERSGATAF